MTSTDSALFAKLELYPLLPVDLERVVNGSKRRNRNQIVKKTHLTDAKKIHKVPPTTSAGHGWLTGIDLSFKPCPPMTDFGELSRWTTICGSMLLSPSLFCLIALCFHSHPKMTLRNIRGGPTFAGGRMTLGKPSRHYLNMRNSHLLIVSLPLIQSHLLCFLCHDEAIGVA